MFLDFDGTLVELAQRPDAVTADEPLRILLNRLQQSRPGRIAIVSGRSIEQLDAMIGPIAGNLALIGSHGAEWRVRNMSFRPVRDPIFSEVEQDFRNFADEHPGVVVESKSLGVALHYRQVPDMEYRAMLLATRLASLHSLHVQCGKMMVELLTPGSDKGEAIRAMMGRAPMEGSVPYVLGDDLTDESGFVVAAELGGAGILVGDREPTAAQWGLSDVSAVRDWLGKI